MKFFATALILFATIALKAQNYIPLLSDSNTWYVQGYEGSLYAETGMSYAVADTNINGLTYKVYVDTTFTSDVFLREDTAERKVWLQSEIGEELIYDFTLAEGDTIVINKWYYNPAAPGNWIVDSVFTIQTVTGTRNAWWLSHEFSDSNIDEPLTGEEGLLWIEGIGASMGPVYTQYFVGMLHGNYNQFRTLCMFRDSAHLYQLHGNDSCVVNYGTVSIDPFKEVSNFQPVVFNQSGKYFLSFGDAEPAKVQLSIIDMNGRQVSKQENYSYTSNIELTSLDIVRPGIYIVRASYSPEEGSTYSTSTIKVMVTR